MLSLWYFLYTMIGYCVTWELFSLKRDFQFLNLALHLLSSGQQLLMCALFFFFSFTLDCREDDVRRFSFAKNERWETPLEFGHRHLTIFDKFSNEMKQVASISKFNFWQRVSKARWNWYPPGGLLCFCGAIKKGLIDKKLHGIITTYSKRSLFNSITFR